MGTKTHEQLFLGADGQCLERSLVTAFGVCTRLSGRSFEDMAVFAGERSFHSYEIEVGANAGNSLLVEPGFSGEA